MPEDLRPAPRLPLDTALVTGTEQDGLGGMIVSEPGEPLFQISLLQSPTPNYWPSAFDRQVYHKPLAQVYGTLAEAEAAAAVALTRFATTQPPKPPQAPGGRS